MSAPVTNKQHTWVSSEDAQRRGQQGELYNYYNPGHTTGTRNDWQTGYTSVQPQVTRGSVDWGYQPQQSYGHQYQQAGTQPAQQYSVYQPHTNVTAANTSSDPWNWGWDDGSNAESSNNNAQPDPTWDWSVEGSTAYQEPVGVNSYGRQHQEPIGTSSNYADHHQEATPTSYPQHTWNTAAHLFGSDSHGQNNLSSYNNSHHIFNHYSNNSETPNSQAILKDTFISTSDVTQKSTDNQSLFQTVGKSHQNVGVFSGGDSVQSLNNNITENHNILEQSVQNSEHNNVVIDKVEQIRSSFHQEATVGTNNIAVKQSQASEYEQNVGNVIKSENLNPIENQFLESIDAASDLQKGDHAVERKHGTSEILASQWSTESLPSQGSDEVSPGLTISEGSSLSEGQINLGYHSSFKTEQADAEGLQDPQLGSVQEGTDSRPMQSPYSVQSGFINNVSCEQGCEDNVALGLMHSGHYNSGSYVELKNIPNEYLSTTSDPSSLHSIDNIGKDIKLMSLGSSSSPPSVENVEIVPPEHDHLSGSFSRPGHTNLTTTPPPPSVASTPPIGLPKSIVGSSSGITCNPFSSGKTSLGHKYGGGKRLLHPQASSGESLIESSPSPQNVTLPETSPSPNPMGGSHFVTPSELMPLYGGGVSRGKLGLMSTTEDAVNLETVPDNKERPDFVDLQQPVQLERKSASPLNSARLHAGPVGQDAVLESLGQWGPQQAETSASPENLEVAPRCGPDRNQYLETGQLTEEELQYRPPPGLRRMVPGQLTESSATPPPGLHRMVPGQLTEGEDVTQDSGGVGGTLHRMVPGRLTEDEPPGGLVTDDAGDGIVPAGSSVDEIPPPGLRRMVPGESSSPESQGGAGGTMLPQPDAVPMEPRVVTGVAAGMQLSPTGCTLSEPESPSSEPNMGTSNLPQPPSERSETIGSDNVETYPPPSTDNSPRDISTRRDASNKERERRHREDQVLEERTGGGSHRRREYYSSRDRERDDSPGSGSRYPEDRERRQYDRDRELDETSAGGRYRDDRDRRRYESRQEYSRRPHEEEQRSRHRRGYDRAGEDADVEDYFSDRDRDHDRERPRPRNRDERDRHDKPPYEYDQHYRGRSDRDRVLEKGGRDRTDHRTSGRDRDRYDRRRHEYPHDYRRGDEYYGRGYEDDYYRDQRSRPSSRTGSRPEYDDDRRRDYHNYGGYNYYGRSAVDLYHYQYYMAAWQRYLQQQGEDRGSVHSGRSSANEELQRERGLEQNSSVLEEGVPTTPQRLTPAKFSTAHAKGTQTCRGQLVKILPHYPLDGQSATVEIHDIQNLIISDERRKELSDFPGPLIRGTTHKKSLMAFCMRKMKSAEQDCNVLDRESVVLLWRLLVLLLRQNGTVVGTDIAELLLSSSSGQESTGSIAAPSPAASQHSVNDTREAQTEEHISAAVNKSEEEVTSIFREYLLYGNTKEALEWAMKQGLWGHALFLASKMDQRTYANVMMRFANGLTLNDPLQTLYQLMSGRLPAAVTCCADERWGDWKPHLAMILSNSSARPDLDHRAITTLGDTLAARGCLHAAHFCYLMAQLEFGSFSTKTSKLVLLGSSHTRPFLEFASNEAIQMTEIYIYTCQLADQDFELPQFQCYKLLYAMRLAEVGLPSEALQYTEVIARAVLRRPGSYSPDFVQQVYEMGNRLKYHDPMFSAGDQDGQEQELAWLVQCRNVLEDYQCGVLQPDGPSYGSTSNLSYSEGDPSQSQVPVVDHLQHMLDHQQYESSWQQQQQPPVYYPDQDQQQWLPQHATEGQGDSAVQHHSYPTQVDQNPEAVLPPSSDSGGYWTQQQWGGAHPTDTQAKEEFHQQQSNHEGEYKHENSQETFNYWEVSANQQEGSPQVTLANSLPAESHPPAAETKSLVKPRAKKEVPKPAVRSSWFGGIWNKIALRPKNQMILPDDKNPSIVWDPDKNRWTNVDGEEDENTVNLPPPPRAISSSNTGTSVDGSENRPPAPPPSGQNIYKMARGRSLRANYVDVLGGNKVTQPTVPAADLFPSMGAVSTTTPNLFIPAPVETSDSAPTDFLTPATSSSEIPEPTSGESSQSAAAVEASNLGYSAPLLFNPSSFAQPTGVTNNSGTLNRKRYPN